MKREVRSLWYIRLRWISFWGQLLILGVATQVFQLTLPLWELIVLLLVVPMSNLAARTAYARRMSETALVGGLLALDTLLLTAILFQAGGPTNPFTIVYLLHVVLAAVMLTPAWTWGCAALSSIGFGLLFVNSRAVPEWSTHGTHHGFSLHLHGMLFAFIIVAVLVTYFFNKIVADLQKKERILERLQNSASNQQKLTSLTTITAGAAHELGTPLATIDVVAHEMERRISQKFPDPELFEDLQLLKRETQRCKRVLQDLADRTGDLIGEAPQALSVGQLIRDALEPLPDSLALQLHGDGSLVLPKVPRKALALAVRALVKNAFEASREKNTPVEVYTSVVAGERLSLVVKDSGSGMSTETLERVGEPFFSGKANGMGLGVYLSRLTAEQLGGSLVLESAVGRGTSARLTFPVDCTLLQAA